MYLIMLFHKRPNKGTNDSVGNTNLKVCGKKIEFDFRSPSTFLKRDEEFNMTKLQIKNKSCNQLKGSKLMEIVSSKNQKT